MISAYYSGGLYRGEKRVMFQMQYLQVLYEAAYFSEQFDTFQKNRSKNGVVPAEKLISQNLPQIGRNFQKRT